MVLATRPRGGSGVPDVSAEPSEGPCRLDLGPDGSEQVDVVPVVGEGSSVDPGVEVALVGVGHDSDPVHGPGGSDWSSRWIT